MKSPKVMGSTAVGLVLNVQGSSSGMNVPKGVFEIMSSLSGWDLQDFLKSYGIDTKRYRLSLIGDSG